MVQFFRKIDSLLVFLIFLLIVSSNPLLAHPTSSPNLRVDAQSAVLTDIL
jgi:hypothetical protein